ncbi:MAG TPA: molybdate ABC transporter permease subunit [Spirochaetota bacterium]|jgi:molybdate transport system permease protein|nr:molybdate ABC transporter permease subunit [Spirochaetota bacterium]HPM34985.1 molybdate ABC transporter permease subunit [Spirochaetota bacterium]HQO22405.1 molybdate ABC transporter permease subunit [Spirochaetota bacterium]HQQ22831.1 molybdate ABC transporter permease subunit [Spirochaetota bacterium]
MQEINFFPLILSFKVSGISTAIAFFAGIPIAYYLSMKKNRIGNLIDSLLNLPIILPPTVLGYYLLVLLGRHSIIGKFLEKNFDIMIVFTPIGAVIAATVVSIPYLIKAVKVSFQEIDEDYLNAARVIGKTEIEIFFTITMPIAWRGIFSGISMAFARALGDFGTTLMIAGSIPEETLTMPVAIYNALQAGDEKTANILVLIMTVIAVTTLFFIGQLSRKKRRGFNA